MGNMGIVSSDDDNTDSDAPLMNKKGREGGRGRGRGRGGSGRSGGARSSADGDTAKATAHSMMPMMGWDEKRARLSGQSIERYRRLGMTGGVRTGRDPHLPLILPVSRSIAPRGSIAISQPPPLSPSPPA
eukprot:6002344-Pyramimonas_sp.AAC.1